MRTVIHVATIISLGLLLIVILIILIIECKKRRQIRNNSYLREFNTTINSPFLNYSSLFALFCCPMTIITGIMTKIPIICSWQMYPISITFWVYIRVFLTLYQIARLRYCFKRTKSLKYGYSEKLFVALNIYGIILIIYVSFGLFTPKYKVYSSKPLEGNMGCTSNPTEHYQLLVSIYAAMYYIWDWFVFLLYIIKIIQFRRKREMEAIVHKKVKFILQKIFLLTLIYEITSALVITAAVDDLLWALAYFLDVFMSAIIIFLMIEHNNDHYLNVIKRLNTWNLCFCCKSLIEDVIEHEQGEIVRDDETSTIYDTQDISKQYDTQMSFRQIMESELTITNETNSNHPLM